MNIFKNIVFTNEYCVLIEGKYDLEQINTQISGEEASFSRFLRSKISRSGIKSINFVVFGKLSPDFIPKEITLLKTIEDQPRDTVHIWTGVILVNNTTEAVSAYRAI
jgi:hypothetical protein